MLNQTGKQLFYESAWESLLHSETAAFDCFSVAGDGLWLSSLPQSVGSLQSHCLSVPVPRGLMLLNIFSWKITQC